MAIGLLYIRVLFLKDLQLLDSTQRKNVSHFEKKWELFPRSKSVVLK
jgi:hypothetical protein